MEREEIIAAIRTAIREEVAALLRVPETIHGTTAAHALLRDHFPEFTATRRTFGNQVSSGKVPVEAQKESGEYIFSGPELLRWYRAGRPSVVEWMAKND